MARKKKTEVREPVIKTGRCRRGSLENLPNMPLDIVVETMSYLEPQDILHLARTTKHFRVFLMARSAEFVWKRARKNVEDLPPCPSDLSEPAYANLAFDTHCHQCLAPGVKMVLWELRARYCPACRKEKFLARAAIIKRFPVLHVLSLYVFEILFPSIPYGSRGSQFYIPYVEKYVNSLPQHDPIVHFSLTIAKEKGWQMQPDMKAKIQHATLCEEWQSKLKDNRQSELQAIRERRRAEIFKRLEALGWGEELGFMQELGWDDLDSHPRLNEPKELTEKVWDNIKPTFEGIMTKTKELRLLLERKVLLGRRLILFNSLYADWRSEQPPDVVLPQAVEFATKDEVRDIITVPEADVVTKQSFHALRDLFPQWIAEWRSNSDAALCAEYVYPSEMEHVPDAVDLNLATTVWACSFCFLTTTTVSVLHYPEVLEHQCMHQRAECHQDDFVFPQDEAEVASRLVNDHSPWACTDVKTRDAPLWASIIIKACGMDPLTATREEMDALDVRLTCNECVLEPEVSDTINTMKVYNWRAAIRHHAMHRKKGSFLSSFLFGLGLDYSYDPPEWERVEDSRISDVKRLEAQAIPFYDPATDTMPPPELAGYSGPLHCSYCPKSGMQEYQLDLHFTRCHGDTIDPSDSKGYLDGSLRHIVPSPVMLISGTEADLRARITAEPGDRVAEAASKWLEEGRAGFLDPIPPQETAVAVA